MNLDILILGEALSPEERKKLPDDAFGVPEERKFPLVDKGHVVSALNYFHSYKGSKERKDVLAMKIFNAAKKHSVHLNPDSKFMIYYNGIEDQNILQENSISGFSYYAEFPEKIIPRHMDGFTPSMTPNEVLEYRNTMSDNDKKELREFIEICEAKIITEDRTEHLQMVANFAEMYMHALVTSSDSFKEAFVRRWKTLIALAEDNNVALPALGVHPHRKIRSIVTESFIPNKFNEMYRTLREGFQYIELNEANLEKEMDKLLDEYIKEPVYVVLTKGTTLGNKIVSAMTKTPYGHASLSFDLSLDNMYTFGTNTDNSNPNKRFMTFIKEDKGFLNKVNNNEVDYHIYAIFVDKDKKTKMEKQIKKMVKEKTKFNYNYVGIFGYLMNTPVKIKDSFFCSEFIASIFRNVGIELFDKPDQLVAPHDFAFSKKFIKVEEGRLTKYDSKKTEKKITRILNKYYSYSNYKEGKLFTVKDNSLDVLLHERFRLTNNKLPIEIDSDGNITFHKLGKPDYASVFAESHRLLILYAEQDNIDGMKYELAKLWVCIKGIETKIYKGTKLHTNEKTQLINTRALIINDFKKYMKVVLEKDPSFNFEQYYKESEFNNAVFKISKFTLKGITALVKELLL